MRISAVTQSMQSELRKVDSIKRGEKPVKSSKAMPVDKSEFSQSAQSANATKAAIEVIATSISSQSDIRTDKIQEVREKIKNGFYESPEFIDKLAEKLLAEFGIKESKL